MLMICLIWLAVIWAAVARGEVENLQRIDEEISRITFLQKVNDIVDLIKRDIINNLRARNGFRYALLDDKGACAAFQKQDALGCPVWSIDDPAAIRFHADNSASFKQANAEGNIEHWRAKRAQLSPTTWLLVARSIEGSKDAVWILSFAGLISIASVFAVSIISAWLLSRRIIKDVQDIASFCKSYRLAGTGSRLPAARPFRETSAIARHINELLDTIDDDVHGLEAYSQRVSHELLTPLTLVKNEIERLEKTAPVRPISFGRVNELIASISHIVKGLYRIAEIRGAKPSYSAINLAALVDDLAELASPLARAKQIVLDVEIPGEATVLGDEILFRQMIWNVIDNAVKYSPSSAAVAIRLAHEDRGVRLVVADCGRGIPGAEHLSVMKPFYRMSADGKTPGAGLGLALVAAIAKRFQVELALEDNEPGLRVVFAFAPGANRSTL